MSDINALVALLDLLVKRIDITFHLIKTKPTLHNLQQLIFLKLPANLREFYSKQVIPKLREVYQSRKFKNIKVIFAGFDKVSEEGPLGTVLIVEPNLPSEVAEALERVFKIHLRVPVQGNVAKGEVISLIRTEPGRIVVPLYAAPIVLTFLALLGVETSHVLEFLLRDVAGLDSRAELGPRPLKLRPYQEEAVQKWFENVEHGIVVLPTGSGKTLVGIAVLASLRKPALVVVPTRDLAEQWRRAIRYFLGTRAGTPEDVAEGKEPSIVVTTYQRLVRWVKEKPNLLLKLVLRRPLVILDEVHHAPAKAFLRAIMSTFPIYVLGLTATPEREDKNENVLYPLIGGIVYRKTYVDLAEAGYLAPILFFIEKGKWRVFAQKYLTELEKKLSELEKAGLEVRTRAVRSLVRRLRWILDPDKGLEAVLSKYVTAISSGNREKARKYLKLLNKMIRFLKSLWAAEKAYSEALKGRKTIVFVRYIRDLVTIYSYLRGVHNYEPSILTAQKWIPLTLDDIERMKKLEEKITKLEEELEEYENLRPILGKEVDEMSRDVRRQLKKLSRELAKIQLEGKKINPTEEIDKFAIGETSILIATPKGEEGIDLPDADTAIFQTVPRSLRAFLQRIGRVSRPREGKIAYVYLMFFPNFRKDREMENTVLGWVRTYFPQDKMRRLAAKVEYWSVKRLEELRKLLQRYRTRPPLETYDIALSKVRPHVPWIDRWFSQVLGKSVNELTRLDKYLLLLLRLILAQECDEYMPVAVDIRKRGTNYTGIVADWLKNPRRYDIPGLDTPEIWKLYQKLKKYLKEGKLEKAIEEVFKNVPLSEVEQTISKVLAMTSIP